jgi:hypothetical protein
MSKGNKPQKNDKASMKPKGNKAKPLGVKKALAENLFDKTQYGMS